MTKTPSFDLIACVGKAYQTVWAERRYFLRLAFIPFLLKIVFFTIGYTNGGDENTLRLTLIMVPAWIVEGWMLAHVVRLILLGQRWPFRPSGDLERDLPIMHSRYRGVMGGAVSFTLIQLLIGGWFALLMYFVPVSLSTPPSETSITPQAAVMACILLGMGIYFFRFLWLFIPAAAGQGVRSSAVRLAPGMGLSLRMLGVWLLCAVPAMMIIQVIVGVILMLLGPDHAGDAVMVISVVAKVALDIVKNLLCAVALAYALREIMS